MATQQDAERLVDRLAADSDGSRADKVEAQFEAKLVKLEHSGVASAEMVHRLGVLWTMFHAPVEQVSWKSRALVMAALGYFVAPFDMIPDLAGKAGYLDDKMVVNIVWSRLGEATAGFSR